MDRSFVLHTEYREQVMRLDMEQRGKLFTAILACAAGEDIPELDPLTDMAFSFISAQIERDMVKWSQTREKRAAAGQKGGKASGKARNQKEANASETEPCEANEAVNINVNVNDNINNIPPKSPTGDKGLFERFWEVYPKKVSKADAAKAFKKLKVDEALLDEMLTALGWQRQSDSWTRDGGKYVLYPATWLNGRRWEDIPEAPPPPVTTYNFVN